MKKPFLWGCMAAVAASATFPAWADTHTVASGETETLNNVTETSRFVKDGEGTLVLGGDNSFKRVTMSAGDADDCGRRHGVRHELADCQRHNRHRQPQPRGNLDCEQILE